MSYRGESVTNLDKVEVLLDCQVDVVDYVEQSDRAVDHRQQAVPD
jgi:hypothetical protein